MDLQSRFLRVGDRAEVASVGLYIAVIHEMCLQVTLCYERIVAAWVHALVRAVIRLYN